MLRDRIFFTSTSNIFPGGVRGGTPPGIKNGTLGVTGPYYYHCHTTTTTTTTSMWNLAAWEFVLFWGRTDPFPPRKKNIGANFFKTWVPVVVKKMDLTGLEAVILEIGLRPPYKKWSLCTRGAVPKRIFNEIHFWLSYDQSSVRPDRPSLANKMDTRSSYVPLVQKVL